MTTALCLALCALAAAQSSGAAKSAAAKQPPARRRTLTIPVPYGAQSTPQGTLSNACVLSLGPAVPVTAVAFSPDGKTLAAGRYQEIIWWDLANARLAKRVGQGQLSESVQALLYTKDGKSLLAADGVPRAAGAVRVFDAQTGRLAGSFTGPKDVVGSAALSPDEKLLAAGSADGVAYVWNMSDRSLVTTIKEHRGWVQTVAFSPDGKLFATGGADRKLLVWETDTWKPFEQLPQPGPVLGAAFSLGGSNLAWTVGGLDNRSLRIRKMYDEPAPKPADPAKPAPPPPRRTRSIDTAPATPLRVVVAPDGKRLLVACSDGTVKVYSAAGDLQATLAGHQDWVYCVAVSPDGKQLAAGSADGLVRLWSTADSRPLATLIQLAPWADDWFILTASGCFDTSTPAAVRWKPATTNTTPGQLVARLWTADAVKDALAGGPGKPPEPKPGPPPAPAQSTTPPPARGAAQKPKEAK